MFMTFRKRKPRKRLSHHEQGYHTLRAMKFVLLYSCQREGTWKGRLCHTVLTSRNGVTRCSTFCLCVRPHTSAYLGAMCKSASVAVRRVGAIRKSPRFTTAATCKSASTWSGPEIKDVAWADVPLYEDADLDIWTLGIPRRVIEWLQSGVRPDGFVAVKKSRTRQARVRMFPFMSRLFLHVCTSVVDNCIDGIRRRFLQQ
jgi:hypothetical protein